MSLYIDKWQQVAFKLSGITRTGTVFISIKINPKLSLIIYEWKDCGEGFSAASAGDCTLQKKGKGIVPQGIVPLVFYFLFNIYVESFFWQILSFFV